MRQRLDDVLTTHTLNRRVRRLGRGYVLILLIQIVLVAVIIGNSIFGYKCADKERAASREYCQNYDQKKPGHNGGDGVE